MRELPYTAEALESLIGRYLDALWPLPVAAPLLALLAIGLILRPLPGAGRMVGGLLAAAWAWVGVGFHISAAASIDFLAPVYGGLFLAQAALLTWSGVLRDHLAAGFGGDAAARVGLVLSAVAILGYPLFALLAGREWPSLPVVGLTPDPTAMLTLGVLLLGNRRPPRHLLVVPVLWALVAGVTGWMLGTPERLVLAAAAAVTVALRCRAVSP